jgi:hypothetical protein
VVAKSEVKMFADESKKNLLSALTLEQEAHEARCRCYDVMVALAGLHTVAMKYAAAEQQRFDTEREVEFGLGVQSQADFDAARAAEAKEAFENELQRFRNAIGRLTVAG